MQKEEEEIWKDVIGYEDYFKVSNLGRVIGKRSGKILKLQTTHNGYYFFSSRLEGRKSKCYNFRVHKLVAEAFLDPPDDYIKDWALETYYKNIPVNHIDGNKLNNCSNNLEWCTGKENTQHAYTLGLIKPLKGMQNPSAKLTEKQVRYIRENYIPRSPIFGARALGRKFNINHKSIINIINNKSYKDII